MNEKIRSYRDLEIWKAGIELVKDIYSNRKLSKTRNVYLSYSNETFSSHQKTLTQYAIRYTQYEKGKEVRKE